MEIINKVLLGICTTIYTFISWTFQIFIYIAEYNILNPNNYEFIRERVYSILGVAVLFIVAYNVLLMIVDPDKNKGGKYFQEIFKKFVTSLILILVTPWIFDFAYQVQNAILEQGVIFKFFLKDNTSNFDETELIKAEKSKIAYAGNEMAVDMFSVFFRPIERDDKAALCRVGGVIEAENLLKNVRGEYALTRDTYCLSEDIDPETTSKYSGFWGHVGMVLDHSVLLPVNIFKSIFSSGQEVTIALIDAHSIVKQTGNFGIYFGFINEIDETIDFDWFLALIAGCYMLYCIVSFCFDMALRLCKLALYYIIAPLCLACRIFPKWESIAKTWYQKTVNTFLSVFNRLIILAMGIFIFRAFADSNFAGFGDSDANFFIKLLGQMFIILGILTFIKQAPKLVDEIFGLGKDVKFGIREKFKDAVTPPQGVLRGTSAIGSAVTSAIQNRNKRKTAQRELDKLNGEGKLSQAEYEKRRRMLRHSYNTFAGFGSGLARGFNQSHDVKDWRGVVNATKKGAQNQAAAADGHLNYFADHGGTIGGMIKGHIGDARRSITDWATGKDIPTLERQSSALGKFTSKMSQNKGDAESIATGEAGKGAKSKLSYENLLKDAFDATKTEQERNRIRKYMEEVASLTGDTITWGNSAASTTKSSDNTLFDKEQLYINQKQRIEDMQRAAANGSQYLDMSIINDEYIKQEQRIKDMQDAASKGVMYLDTSKVSGEYSMQSQKIEKMQEAVAKGIKFFDEDSGTEIDVTKDILQKEVDKLSKIPKGVNTFITSDILQKEMEKLSNMSKGTYIDVTSTVLQGESDKLSKALKGVTDQLQTSSFSEAFMENKSDMFVDTFKSVGVSGTETVAAGISIAGTGAATRGSSLESLEKLRKGVGTVDDFKNGAESMKDDASADKARLDIEIATRKKDEAAKGDNNN